MTFQAVAGMHVGDISRPISSSFGFNSAVSYGGRNDARADVLTGHRPEPRLLTSAFQPVNGTSMSDVGGFGYSGKISLGACDPNRSPPMAGSISGLTHISPAAIRNADRQLSPPKAIKEVDQGRWLPGFTQLLTEEATHYRQKRGQFTLINNLSPDGFGLTGSFSDDAVTEPLSSEQCNDIDAAQVGDTKRRAKAASRDDGSRPTSKRSTKGSEANKQVKSQGPGEEAKREKVLERNRMAATKYRQKKREWENSLETRARELAAERARLSACVASLKGELLCLKGECLKHTHCNCTRICEYLNHTVAMMLPASSPLCNLADDMLVDLEASKSSSDNASESVFGPHLQQDSMGVGSAPAPATAGEDILPSLSASIR